MLLKTRQLGGPLSFLKNKTKSSQLRAFTMRVVGQVEPISFCEH